MKKIIITLLLFIINTTFATDSCEKIILEKINFKWEIIWSVSIRDYPCTYNSNTIWIVSKWEIYNVIWKVDEWYKIEFKWDIAWIWDQKIKKIWSYIEDNQYKLTTKDKKLISMLIKNIDNISLKNWNKTYKLMYNNIYKVKNKYIVWSKNNIIIKALLEKLNEKIKPKNNNLENIIKLNDENNIIYDDNKVKQAWLNWINKIRNDKW